MINNRRAAKLKEKKEYEDSKTKSFTNQYAAIEDILNKYKPYKKSNLVKIPPEINESLFKLYGTHYDRVLKSVYDIWIRKQLKRLRKLSYMERLKEEYANDIPISLTQQDKIEIKYILNILYKNKINWICFFASFMYIYNKTDPKKNILCLEGPTNTGKTMIINLLLDNLQATSIAKNSDSDRFQFSNCTSAPAVLFEEPTITMTNVNTYKKFWGGQETETDVKNSCHELVERLPWFITCNEDIGMNIVGYERQAIEMRLIKFELFEPISDGIINTSGIPRLETTIKGATLQRWLLTQEETLTQALTAFQHGKFNTSYNPGSWYRDWTRNEKESGGGPR
ncbi:uncharacterized protein [Procambarus clarkii]|uniref:uncharacterized protein n=1 Tax=Procambarus clarkii TaxID=6728 RepID=UPI003741EEFA